MLSALGWLVWLLVGSLDIAESTTSVKVVSSKGTHYSVFDPLLSADINLPALFPCSDYEYKSHCVKVQSVSAEKVVNLAGIPNWFLNLEWTISDRDFVVDAFRIAVKDNAYYVGLSRVKAEIGVDYRMSKVPLPLDGYKFMFDKSFPVNITAYGHSDMQGKKLGSSVTAWVYVNKLVDKHTVQFASVSCGAEQSSKVIIVGYDERFRHLTRLISLRMGWGKELRTEEKTYSMVNCKTFKKSITHCTIPTMEPGAYLYEWMAFFILYNSSFFMNVDKCAAGPLPCHFAVSAEPVSTKLVSTEPVSTEPVSAAPVSTEPVYAKPAPVEPVSVGPVSHAYVSVEPEPASRNNATVTLVLAICLVVTTSFLLVVIAVHLYRRKCLSTRPLNSGSNSVHNDCDEKFNSIENEIVPPAPEHDFFPPVTTPMLERRIMAINSLQNVSRSVAYTPCPCP